MPEIKMPAEIRTEFGKGAARRLRRAGRVPAFMYEHGMVPIHVSLPGHEMMMALKNANALFAVDVEGETHLAITKEVQRNPVRGEIQHIDLLLVRHGERVAVDVPIVVLGESAPGTIHIVDTQTLSVEAEATALPKSIEVNIDGMAGGHLVLAGDVQLPDGVTLLADPEALVLAITDPQAEASAAEIAEAAAEAAAAEAAQD